MFLGTGWDGDGIDKVAVVVVEDEYVLVAADGWCQERAGLVGEDAACCLDAVGVDGMGAFWLVKGCVVDVMRCVVCLLG